MAVRRHHPGTTAAMMHVLALLPTAGSTSAISTVTPSPSPPPFTPTDTDCIKWVKVSSDQLPDMSHDLLIVGHQDPCHEDGAPGGVWGELLCMTPDGTQAGHVDATDRVTGYKTDCTEQDNGCNLWNSASLAGPRTANGSGHSLDGIGPLSYYYLAVLAKTNLTWTKYSKGAQVPTNAYEVGGLLIGRGLINASRKCRSDFIYHDNACRRNVMPGYVKPAPGNILGPIQFEDFGSFTEDTFELATCHSPTHLRYRCSNQTHQCVTTQTNESGTFPTQQECAMTCRPSPPPPSPSPPSPPPPPLSTNPCIRFGHTIPVDHHVDVEIKQDPPGPPITHTWTNFKFGDFSDWVNLFKPGTGTITVYENTGGTRGGQLYQLKGIPLTPGPLVVVIKVAASLTANASAYWPLALPDSIETIAASYVDTDHTSKVRLFNLAPEVKLAGMTCSTSGTAEIATNVSYSLGSEWQPVATESATYTFKDDVSKKTLATKTLTPAAPPIGNTNVLVGLASASGAFGIQAISLVDAPEGGTCHP